jgi:hypothetical protein
MTVISLAQRREELAPHMQGEALCTACGHTWHAVVPAGVIWMECPECHTMRGLCRYPLCRDASHVFQCPCGGEVWDITVDGNEAPVVTCVRCGCASDPWASIDG